MRTRITAAVSALAVLGLGADQAAASYTAKVQGGTLEITGNGASDQLLLVPDGATTLAVDVDADGTVDFSFDRGSFTAIDVSAGGGADTVRLMGSLVDEVVTVDGGGGGDTLTGTVGNETLIGGSGDDVVRGGDGDDVALLGTGDDTFAWSPGDDDDVVEGAGGDDALDFAGSNAAEQVDVSANGSRARFFRNIANVTTDLAGVERVAFAALGGADTVVVNPLAGTEVEAVDVSLEAFGGGGDAQLDSVVYAGTEGADAVRVGESGGLVAASGLGAEARVAGAEAQDAVTVRSLGGDDAIAAAVGIPGPADVNADGGLGGDTVVYEGTAADDDIHVVANGAEVRVGPVLDVIAEELVLRGLGGADWMTGVGNLAALTRITMDGGSGPDRLAGSNGADVLLGGSGDDEVDGNQGIDTPVLGSGDDRFSWDPGDGSDTIEGEGGDDTVRVNGNAASETYDVSANGARVRFFRNIANITLDLGGVEDLDLGPAGGTDTVVIGHTGGTDLEATSVDLAAIAGGGDLAADTVTLNGTEAADSVRLSRSGRQVLARGLGGNALVGGAELGQDALRVHTHGGDDRVTVGDVFDLVSPIVDLGADE